MSSHSRSGRVQPLFWCVRVRLRFPFDAIQLGVNTREPRAILSLAVGGVIC